MPGFHLSADVYEIAAYHGIRARSLRRKDPRHGAAVTIARHALFWKLVTVRELTPARVASMFNCTAEAVRKAVAAHDGRIKEFRETTGLKGN